MAAILCPSATQAGTSQSDVSVGLRKDWDEYLRERLCKIPPTPSTSVIIEEIIESTVDSGASAPKKGQAMSAIEGFPPLVLVLLAIVESFPASIQKGTFIVPVIQDFDPLVLPRLISGISRVPGLKSLEATLSSPKMFSIAPNL